MQLGLEPKKINSWLIAGILCINTFSKILSIIVYIPYNIVLMETGILFILAELNKRRIPLKRELIVILLIVAGIMGYSVLLYRFDGRVIERLLKFIMYAFFAMISIQYPNDETEIIKGIYFIGYLYVSYLYFYAAPMISAGLMELNSTMDLSYTSLGFLIAAFFMVEDPKIHKINKIIAVVMGIAIIYFLVAISMNRGSLIAAACFFALYFVQKKEKLSSRVIGFLLVVISAVIVYINLIPLLEMVEEFTTSRGFVINPLRKTIQQMNYSDSMTSGREDVYTDAIKLIRDTNALPNGVASFEILLNGKYYPHNIFLEACIEFGFIGLILIAVIICKACHSIVIAPGRNKRIILMFFCLSLPRLMFSSSYWENSFIWPLMMLLWRKD